MESCALNNSPTWLYNKINIYKIGYLRYKTFSDDNPIYSIVELKKWRQKLPIKISRHGCMTPWQMRWPWWVNTVNLWNIRSLFFSMTTNIPVYYNFMLNLFTLNSRQAPNFVCIFLLLTIFTPYAAANSVVNKVTDLYLLAMDKDKEFQIVKKKYIRDKELLTKSRYYYFPNIYGEVELRETNPETMSKEYGGLYIDIPIYNKEKSLEENVDTLKLDSSTIEYRQAEIDLLVRTIDAFFGILTAKQHLVIHNQKLDLYRRQISAMETLLKAKYASMTDLDLYTLKSEYSQALSQQIIAQKEYNYLKKKTSKPMVNTLTITGSLLKSGSRNLSN